MFFGAISTDIKKSSTLWANLPQWMETAVQRTNNITVYIINMTKNKNITQHILPNSPEGDAWTVVYEGKDQQELKKHVKHVAHFLKYVYKQARDKNILSATQNEIDKDLDMKFDTKNKRSREVIKKLNNEKEATMLLVSEKPFFRKIYVRIGVAFSDVAPIKYQYEAKTPDNRVFPYTSYWESVVKHSERAEEQAPWESGIGVTQAGEKVKHEEATEQQKRFEVTVKIKSRTASINLETFALNKDVYNQKKYEVKAVNGYMIFVHYKLHITMKQVKQKPHLYDSLINEFTTVHSQCVNTFNDTFKNKAYLVKVKRSSDSMFYIKDTVAPSTIWNNCLTICGALPSGSSIGIAFTKNDKPSGTLKRLEAIEEDINGIKKVDYFGDCVNLSARMDTLDWEYDTKWFSVAKNCHMSRVAMCSADNKTSGWSGWNNSKPGCPNAKFIRPILVEDIPRDTLNAGKKEENLRVISAHVRVGNNIQAGDEVYWEEKDKKKIPNFKGEVTDTYYGRVLNVNFLFILVEEIKDKSCPEGESKRQWINLTYLKKCPRKKLTQEAEVLSVDEETKPSINKTIFPLKF